MTEIEREEFLARLDLRISTMASMLGYHEKWIANNFMNCGAKREQVKDLQDNIDKSIITFWENIKEQDQKIKDYFRELEEKLNNTRRNNNENNN